MSLFKKIELSDRDWINNCLSKEQYKGCEYSFANNFIWREASTVSIAHISGYYCLRGHSGTDSLYYIFPTGEGDFEKAVDTLIADADSQNKKLVFKYIPEEALPVIENYFPDKFEITEDRDNFDYIYSAEKLSTLSGKKLHSKRNHINAFIAENNWAYEPIGSDNLDECFEMSKKWCELYGCGKDKSLASESCAVKNALTHFTELNLAGGLIRADNKVIAYSIGEPLTEDTFVVHIEKAFADIRGAYPIINQQFVINNCGGFKYVNREDDAGDDGLRKAKLSYYPDILYKKYTATLK